MKLSEENLYLLNKDSTVSIYNLKKQKLKTNLEIFDKNQKPFELKQILLIENRILAVVCKDYLFVLDETNQKIV